MPLLGDIFGAADAFKRSLADLMRNPLASAQQRLGLLGDQAGAANRDINLLADQNALRMQGSVMADAPQYRQAEDASRQRMFNALMNFAPVGATVWHGSPHKFDKFDASKIGTGEGAQAYGHGLYLAEEPQVAREYQEILSKKQGPIGAPDRMRSSFSETAVVNMFQNRKAAGLSDELAREQTLKWALNEKQIDKSVAESLIPRLQTNTGSLYKVDLPDEAIAKMLDWDKPLSQQAQALEIAKKVFSDPRRKQAGFQQLTDEQIGALTGADLYQAMKPSWRGGERGASSDLLNAGIPGIRYLDGGSRGAGQGTSNYVVFPGNEGLLNILERNGKPIKE